MCTDRSKCDECEPHFLAEWPAPPEYDEKLASKKLQNHIILGVKTVNITIQKTAWAAEIWFTEEVLKNWIA